MKDEFVTYQKHNDPALAQDIVDFLLQHDIPFETEKTADYFDVSFAKKETDTEIKIKLRNADFEKVDKLLEAEAAKHLGEEDKNHYLHNLSEKELLEILAKPDEWNPFDYLMAQKILKARGKEVTEQMLQQLKKERTLELHQPEKSQFIWVFLGYVFALGGGLLGMFIGWHLNSFKKTLPTGERIYAYSEEDRKSGKTIFLIALPAFIFWLILGIVLQFKRLY